MTKEFTTAIEIDLNSLLYLWEHVPLTAQTTPIKDPLKRQLLLEAFINWCSVTYKYGAHNNERREAWYVYCDHRDGYPMGETKMRSERKQGSQDAPHRHMPNYPFLKQ